MADQEIPRLARLTAILTMLQSKRLITAGYIADRFGISIRTVYRDIRALESSGVPVFTEDGKGYSLMEDYRMAPVMLTEAECNALITAESMVIKNKDISFVNNYASAITKIKAQLNPATKDKIEKLSGLISFRQNLNQDITSHYLSEIQLAITNFNPVKIEYRSENQTETISRVIEPLAMYSTNENWILIAFCRLRDEIRSFRLDRISKSEVLPETFKSHNFDFEEYYAYYRKKYFDNP
ncbi:WYL domain-containing protein [Emticicia sp. CRIBPO]|uniref:helix-turn-helix transcriptional regulator n=1 Tax=Emticicia sp. CRIBPO TaxID=2683258 RepID=UPI001412FF3F|nr:YafY family protein [Emticicia sp. CRIBPO]NBA88582.1 WYL domain-containing protein [Emticicia sp. CRIBPO]